MLKLFAESSMQDSQIFVPDPKACASTLVADSTYFAATGMVDKFETYCDLRVKYKESGRLRSLPYWLSMQACQATMQRTKMRQTLANHTYLYTFHRPEDIDKPAQAAALVLDEGAPVRRIDLGEFHLENDVWLWLSHTERSRLIGERTLSHQLSFMLNCATEHMDGTIEPDEAYEENSASIQQCINHLYEAADVEPTAYYDTVELGARLDLHLGIADGL